MILMCSLINHGTIYITSEAEWHGNYIYSEIKNKPMDNDEDSDYDSMPDGYLCGSNAGRKRGKVNVESRENRSRERPFPNDMKDTNIPISCCIWIVTGQPISVFPSGQLRSADRLSKDP
jgi:hypothetical protein